MNTYDLFKFIINNDSMILKHNYDNGKIESYHIVSAEMPDESTLYIYGKKPGLNPKYAFIISPIFSYDKDSSKNINIFFNNRLEFTLSSVA